VLYRRRSYPRETSRQTRQKKTRHRAAAATPNLESAAGDESMAAQKDAGPLTPCRIHLHSLRHRPPDIRGLSEKAVIDGLIATATNPHGLFPNDSAKYVNCITDSWEVVPAAQTEITILVLEWYDDA
jgi:hypothetical protein